MLGNQLASTSMHGGVGGAACAAQGALAKDFEDGGVGPRPTQSPDQALDVAGFDENPGLAVGDVRADTGGCGGDDGNRSSGRVKEDARLLVGERGDHDCVVAIDQ